MAWTITNEADNAIILEMSRQTDRGAALIAQAYLEERLNHAIKSRLANDKSTYRKLFKPAGPIGAFATKADLGYLLGIYEKDIRDFLHTIAEVRNIFAHHAKPRDFSSREVRKLCMKIDISIKTEMDVTAPNGEVKKMEFSLQSDASPKTAFFNMIMYILLALDMEINISGDRGPAEPVFQSLAKPFLSPPKES